MVVSAIKMHRVEGKGAQEGGVFSGEAREGLANGTWAQTYLKEVTPKSARRSRAEGK